METPLLTPDAFDERVPASSTAVRIPFDGNQLKLQQRIKAAAGSRDRTTSASSVTSMASIIDEEVNEGAMNYPPLHSSHPGLTKLRLRAAKDIQRHFPGGVRALRQLEWVCAMVGGILFIWGSYLFLPSLPESTKAPAAIMFIIGSILFEIAAVGLYYRLGAYFWKDLGLSINSVMYVVANATYIVGSCFFYPGLAETYELIGIWCFVFGSVIFLVSPLYDIFRAYGLFAEVKSQNRSSLAALSMSMSMSMHANPVLSAVAAAAPSPSPPPLAQPQAKSAANVNDASVPSERDTDREEKGKKDFSNYEEEEEEEEDDSVDESDDDGGGASVGGWSATFSVMTQPVAVPVPTQVSARIDDSMQLEAIKNAQVMNYVTFLCKIVISFCYVTGSGLFVVGSIMFLPLYYSRDAYEAVSVFIAGSCMFFLAAITTIIAKVLLAALKFCRCCWDWEEEGSE